MSEDERPKFERFAELTELPVTRYDKQSDGTGKYIDPQTRIAWTAWQARAFIDNQQ